ncbi:MAG TPA: mitochondrial fission ELM1 family protein [Micropepsaceae bacterium]|nr:mitochondrial fission ELM1 family protein [Micropepsaceae bacterium]
MGSDARPLSCWVVTDGKAGMESQCVGLAEALGLTPVVKRVRLREPWRHLTPYVRIGGRAQFARGSDALAPPWPDLLIATGRHSVAGALLVKKLSGGCTKTVQLQNPVISASHFDLVVVPRHDRLEGANILSTRGALHRVTPVLLLEGAERLAPKVAHLKRPYIGVLIGGANASYRLGPAEMTILGGLLAAAARAVTGSLLVTPSRRTGAENIGILKAALAHTPHDIWDGQGDNPYFGILGLADFLVVTCDSVNMVSESASTGKPVYVFDLPGGSPKFARFHQGLREEGVTRAFTGSLANYTYAPLDDVSMVAARVKALLQK